MGGPASPGLGHFWLPWPKQRAVVVLGSSWLVLQAVRPVAIAMAPICGQCVCGCGARTRKRQGEAFDAHIVVKRCWNGAGAAAARHAAKGGQEALAQAAQAQQQAAVSFERLEEGARKLAEENAALKAMNSSLEDEIRALRFHTSCLWGTVPQCNSAAAQHLSNWSFRMCGACRLKQHLIEDAKDWLQTAIQTRMPAHTAIIKRAKQAVN